MILRLAWRNIWRNKRRTIITAASVFTAVIVALLMRSTQLGSYQHIIDNAVSLYTGPIQLHRKGYWNDNGLDNSFVESDSVYTLIKKSLDVNYYTLRFESFALASAKKQTKGALVAGIEPDGEERVTRLKEKLIRGAYLSDSGNSVLLAQGLALELDLGVGDTLVLLGQGYHGASAAGLFPVRGIVKFPTLALNQGMVFMPITLARGFFSAAKRVTSIVMTVPSGTDATAVAKKLRSYFKGSQFEIMDWKQMLPDLLQLIKTDNLGGIIAIVVLYVLITFGIFGTLLMMITERMHEFGTLLALGMKRMQLTYIVSIEILLISGLGIFLGLVLGGPIIAYFHFNPIQVAGESAKAYSQFGLEPIFPFSMKWTIFLWQVLVVEGITLLLAFYPYFILRHIKTIEALKR